jgi:pimeloyl-ACP methyl ester carboxylesterase
VAPAIFFSATALLILSINVRLMGIVAKLRYFVHAKHDAAKGGRLEEAEAYTSQIQSIEKRAEMIRRAFLFSLLGLVGTLMACLLLGLGLYFKAAEIAAAIIFISLHGILATSKRAEPNAIRAKVLVLHGDADPVAPMTEVTAFMEEMRAANANWEIDIYGDARHSFTGEGVANKSTP